uniref:LRRC37A/B like protein 1 C-terminal domain-containing protein n=1 Tax=Myotis lucifugus TaxID=59463 RepID=G1P3C9_MYOLU
ITPEHTSGAAATALQQTAAPPKPSEVTFPPQVLVQGQWPSIPPVDLGLTITPEHTSGAAATALQQTAAPAKPSEPTFLAVDLELTITPESTVETGATALQQTTAPAKHPEADVTALQQTTAPAKHPEVTLEHPELQPTESSETVPPMTEQSATMNICELCSCSNGTLSCIGFGSKQRLNRVPVPEPSTYNGTFTILNLQGNAISYIGKDTWKSYHLVEKLNLSANNLRELRKDSFEGLASLQYLDLSCNKIEFIEKNAFDSLPLLQYINLGCNLITKVNFGTFQTWDGMQLLHKLILHENPLMTVQDPYLFNLPALKYLDMGRTQVTLTTLDNILMTAPELEKLILPNRLACCLCQFKNNIEAVAKTVKLNCETECVTDTPCDEELIIEGLLMHTLQARQDTSTELTIEPERASSVKNPDTSASIMSEQLDFNNKSDVNSALNYQLPYFLEGNLEEIESTLLPFIKLPLSNVHDADMSLNHLKNNRIGLLMRLLTEQQEVKISNSEWDEEQWKDERMQTLKKQEERVSNELRQEVPRYKKEIIIASPVIAVTTFYFVVFCLLVV